MPELIPALSEFTRQPVVSLPVSVKNFVCVVSMVSNAQHYEDKAVMELQLQVLLISVLGTGM
jgi:hypothetical protein